MSRSYRHTPVFGITTARSEKQDKTQANRRLRRNVKSSIIKGDEVMPLLREVSDVWSFDKDGKTYLARRMREKHAKVTERSKLKKNDRGWARIKGG